MDLPIAGPPLCEVFWDPLCSVYIHQLPHEIQHGGGHIRVCCNSALIFPEINGYGMIQKILSLIPTVVPQDENAHCGFPLPTYLGETGVSQLAIQELVEGEIDRKPGRKNRFKIDGKMQPVGVLLKMCRYELIHQFIHGSIRTFTHPLNTGGQYYANLCLVLALARDIRL